MVESLLWNGAHKVQMSDHNAAIHTCALLWLIIIAVVANEKEMIDIQSVEKLR